MKKLICIFALCLALCACAGDVQNSSDEAVTATTTTTEAATITEANSSKPVESSASTETSKPAEKPKPVERMAINVEVLSYKDRILTFKYEDKEYSLPFSRWDFDNEPFDDYYPCCSESIINNKYGETVNAKLSVNKDISEIFKCDVVKPNGEVYHGEHPYVKNETGKLYLDKDKLYSFKQGEGTLCEIANKNESLEFDLNDLPMNLRLDYPEDIDLVKFTAYRFKDGKTILVDLEYNVKIEIDDHGEECVVGYGYGNDPNKIDAWFGFFGVVQSVSEDGDKITFLLNDKKTLCTVPTYFNDGGEFKEGAEIMVKLKSDVSLFGSGGEHEFDYAVIYTDPEYYNQTGENNQYWRGIYVPSGSTFAQTAFDNLAYSEIAFNLKLTYTTVREVE